MYLYISACILVMLAVVGLVELLRRVIFYLFKRKDAIPYAIVLPIYEQSEDCEYILRSTLADSAWNGNKNFLKKIYCIDCGMDKITKEICKIFCNEHNEIELCTQEEFVSLLKANELL